MGLKTFKSYTKSTRGTVLVDRKSLWKGKPLKSLTVGSHSTGGRNNLGRITSRHKGGGHKQKYRQIDFYRKKDNIKAKIERIEYDPNRSAYLALIKYEDNIRNFLYENSKSDDYEIESTINKITNELDQNQKKLIKMNFFEQKSHKNIAEELEIPLGKVKSRIRATLNKMLKHIQ